MSASIVTAGSTDDLAEIGGLLVTTLEDAYNAVRRAHNDIPAAVIVISSRPPTQTRQVWGHFAHSRWDVNGVKLPEIMISAEGLRRPPREVLATLVHEAAHGVSFSRGIQDTSRKGSFHNWNFRKAAEELGLVVTKVAKIGFSDTTLPEGTYDEIVKDISTDLIAYRETEVTLSQTGSSKRRTEFPYRCSCPRTIRVHEGIYDLGPVLCGVCGDEFM